MKFTQMCDTILIQTSKAPKNRIADWHSGNTQVDGTRVSGRLKCKSLAIWKTFFYFHLSKYTWTEYVHPHFAIKHLPLYVNSFDLYTILPCAFLQSILKLLSPNMLLVGADFCFRSPPSPWSPVRHRFGTCTLVVRSIRPPWTAHAFGIRWIGGWSLDAWRIGWCGNWVCPEGNSLFISKQRYIFNEILSINLYIYV